MAVVVASNGARDGAGPARLIAATRLAATEAPDQQADQLIRHAARVAAESLERGQSVPLPVTLDLLNLQAGAADAFRPPGGPVGYELFLCDVIDAARVLCHEGDDPSPPGLSDLNLAPLLTDCFTSHRADPDLARALRALAQGHGVHEVLEAWRGPRTLEAWQDWFPDQLPIVIAGPGAGTTWAAFASIGDGTWLDEDCDHEAARRFLLAESPLRSRLQEDRLRRLRRRRPAYEPNPLPEAYDEPNAVYGSSTLATLASGEYGEFLIVNRADPRLVNPPLVAPPPTLHLHLCWAYGPMALDRLVPAPAYLGDDRTKLDGVESSQVSVLQAFCALVFDDWREMLRRVDVRLHAHCGAPRDAQDDFGPPGPSWQPGRRRRSNPAPSAAGFEQPAWINIRLPPPRFVRRFFTRGTWVGLDACSTRWQRERSTSHWWCLVLLEDDLASTELSTDLRDGTAKLPDCLSSVIVLDPSTCTGAFYWAHQLPGEGLRLQALLTREFNQNDADPSGLGLRTLVLEAVLRALEVAG